MGKTTGISVRLHKYRGRAYGLIWRCGQRSGEVSSGTSIRREAERAAGRLEEQLEAGIIPGNSDGVAITWASFRERYEREWLEGMSRGSRGNWKTAADHFEELCHPRLLVDVDKSMLSKYRAGLDSKGISPTSATSYYRALRAGLGWAADVVGLIDTVPTIRSRRKARQSSAMRSRPITLEEFERMVAVAPAVRPRDHEHVVKFMRGLWLTGLRIDELRNMTWEESPCHVDLKSRPPLIVFLGGQKNGADSYLPAPPEFWKLIGRGFEGYVCHVPGRREQQMTTGRICRAISDIGDRAKVVVNKAGKTATAHDLRRAYITGVAAKATMSQTQQLARHADPRTTAKHYIRHEAEALAASMGWA